MPFDGVAQYSAGTTTDGPGPGARTPSPVRERGTKLRSTPLPAQLYHTHTGFKGGCFDCTGLYLLQRPGARTTLAGGSAEAVLLINAVDPVGLPALEFRTVARGPGDRDRVGRLGAAQAEGQRALDGREVALGVEELSGIGPLADLDSHLGAERVAVRGVAGQDQSEPVVL